MALSDQHCETPAECLANAITHGVGLILAIAATAALLAGAAAHGDPLRIATLTIFGATLIGVYLASTLFHLARDPRTQRLLQKIDHIAIYLLIAGTYTPFMLVTFGGAWGRSLLIVVWAIAAFGVVFKILRTGRHRWFSTALYLVMGWLVVLAGDRLLSEMSPAGLAWLVAGGLAYTVGVAFYLWRRLRFSHAVWHCFVIAGSACHAAAMWVDVVKA